MNKEARAVIAGMVIGDGYLNVSKTKKESSSGNRSELRVMHGKSQEDYCRFKASLLRKYIGGKFTVTKVRNGPQGKYESYQFCCSHPYFKQMKKWFYVNGEKNLNFKNLQMLNPQAIAIWYMDDGSARTNCNKNGYISSVSTDIATMCSLTEVKDIVCFFDFIYGIKFNIRFDKRQGNGHNYYIQCNTKESIKFIELIGNYIIPSMSYKIDHVDFLKSHERLTPTSFCINCDRPIYQERRSGLCGRCYSKKYYRNIRKFKKVGDDIVRACRK